MIGSNTIILCESQLLDMIRAFFEEKLESTPVSICQDTKGGGSKFEIKLEHKKNNRENDSNPNF